MCIRILLVDDHSIIRQGLRVLLEKKPKFEVVGEAENGRVALSMARKLEPDVIVMDINMPDLNGVDAARQILAERPESRIIALSMYSDRSYVKGMLKAGVAGYLLKNCAFDELTKAILAVAGNQTYLSPKVSDIVRKEFVKLMDAGELGVAEALTDKEREVLQMIAEGKKTKDIAERLHISVKTVEARRGKIMEKLRINSVAGLTKFAIREGLTSVEI
ncbi:response regulator [Desulfatitalea alkaliphila]|uniref:Response regulator transcription factor n=1 Tax=Desulfatitalea alkaliphila TaxID=2929485 RepID=A0AA41UJX9_9BACT|nr:response regulator transcription factor [Desulfatitalea alkaliphila]MCJ8500907.1 response regulator transcription factor [Desulfatitalea alkaliphila]